MPDNDRNTFLNLPLELLHEIGWFCKYQRDVFALAKTCQTLAVAYDRKNKFFWFKSAAIQAKQPGSLANWPFLQEFDQSIDYKKELQTHREQLTAQWQTDPYSLFIPQSLCMWCLRQARLLQIEWDPEVRLDEDLTECVPSLEMCEPCLVDNTVTYEKIRRLMDQIKFHVRATDASTKTKRNARKRYWAVDLDFLTRKYHKNSLFLELCKLEEKDKQDAEERAFREGYFNDKKKVLVDSLASQCVSKFQAIPTFAKFFENNLNVDSFELQVKATVEKQLKLLTRKTVCGQLTKDRERWKSRVDQRLTLPDEQVHDLMRDALAPKSLLENIPDFAIPLVQYHQSRLEQYLRDMQSDYCHNGWSIIDHRNQFQVTEFSLIMGRCALCSPDPDPIRIENRGDRSVGVEIVPEGKPGHYYTHDTLPWHYFREHPENLVNDLFLFSSLHAKQEKILFPASAGQHNYVQDDTTSSTTKNYFRCGQPWEESCKGVECSDCNCVHQCLEGHFTGDLSKFFTSCHTLEEARNEWLINEFAQIAQQQLLSHGIQPPPPPLPRNLRLRRRGRRFAVPLPMPTPMQPIQFNATAFHPAFRMQPMQPMQPLTSFGIVPPWGSNFGMTNPSATTAVSIPSLLNSSSSTSLPASVVPAATLASMPVLPVINPNFYGVQQAQPRRDSGYYSTTATPLISPLGIGASYGAADSSTLPSCQHGIGAAVGSAEPQDTPLLDSAFCYDGIPLKLEGNTSFTPYYDEGYYDADGLVAFLRGETADASHLESSEQSSHVDLLSPQTDCQVISSFSSQDMARVQSDFSTSESENSPSSSSLDSPESASDIEIESEFGNTRERNPYDAGLRSSVIDLTTPSGQSPSASKYAEDSDSSDDSPRLTRAQKGKAVVVCLDDDDEDESSELPCAQQQLPSFSHVFGDFDPYFEAETDETVFGQATYADGGMFPDSFSHLDQYTYSQCIPAFNSYENLQ